jgi:hypothetical protein
MEWEANGSLATALQGVSPLQHANLSLLFWSKLKTGRHGFKMSWLSTLSKWPW